MLPSGSVAQPPSDKAFQDSAGIVLGPGVHNVAGNLTLKVDLMLLPGARIAVAAGRTLTLLGDLQAPTSHIFIGSGKVDLIRSRVPVAHPEWWGARPDDGTYDSLPALHACLAAHHAMQLGAGDYFIGSTFLVDRPHRRIWGAGYRSGGNNGGTRLVVMNGRDDVVRVGTQTKPSSVNDFLPGIDMRWIELSRSAPVAPNGPDDGAGMRVRFVLFSHFEGISAPEHANSFSILGAVRTYFRDCLAFRSLDGAASDKGVYRGFHLDGRQEIGLAGGNASVYLIDCNTIIGGTPRLTQTVGMFLEGAFSDSYIVNFETSNVPVGIRMEGGSGRMARGRQRSGHADVHILMPIIDQCAMTGIEIKDTSDHSLIDIVDPYVALAPGALAAIFLDSVRGLSTISGGQVIGWVNADAKGNGIGLYALRSEGFETSGLKLLGLRRPITIEQCADFSVSAAINNPGQGTSQGAAWLRQCRRGAIRIRAKGSAGAFPQGVYLSGSENAAIIVDVSGVDPAAVGGAGSQMVVANDRPLAVPSLSGTIETIGHTR